MRRKIIRHSPVGIWAAAHAGVCGMRAHMCGIVRKNRQGNDKNQVMQ